MEGLDKDESPLCGPCEDARYADVPELDVRAVFAPGGPLARPGFEVRPGQVRLAHEILQAFATNGALLAEGPCGIGKSKAYGVPAAWFGSHGKKVLIVTESIALQEQLVSKDLPGLRAELGWDFKIGLLKGRSNYLCKVALEEDDDDQLREDEMRDYRRLRQWADETTTGDKSDLPFVPSPRAWQRVSVVSEDCQGSKCKLYGACYATKAKEMAKDAGVIVTNYHMLFLDINNGGKILPSCDVAVLDESHKAPDIARELLGYKLTETAFKKLAKYAERKGDGHLSTELRMAARDFFAALRRFHGSPYYKGFLRSAVPIPTHALEQACASFAARFEGSPQAEKAQASILAATEGIGVINESCVYSLEEYGNSQNRQIALACRWVDPGPALANLLWPKFESTVCVSATLTTDNKFDFTERELGAPAGGRLMVPSPFNFKRQACLLVAPKQAPAPNDLGFAAFSLDAVAKTIEACDGRTLVLFTSYKSLNACYEEMSKRYAGRYTILRQGDLPAQELVRRFKEDASSCLLATSSFWTGVDVPGEALTGLVIERLPFGQPDDPVSVRIGERDRNAFGNYTIPRSILQLRQGVGRLIRSQTDVGAVVILDNRCVTKTYGKRFLASLPDMTRIQSTSQIKPFLEGAR